MRKTISIFTLILVYLVVSFLLADNYWLSKGIPPVISVLAAWLVNRNIHAVAVLSGLASVAIILPVSFLLLALPAQDSLAENTKFLFKNLSAVDMLGLVVPLIVGYAALLIFTYRDAAPIAGNNQ